MFLVGDNLKQLVEQCAIVDNPRAFDGSSLSLHLDRSITAIVPTQEVLTYGDELPPHWLNNVTIPAQGHVLEPGSCILGCSVERISMPLGFIGFIQTKGSLARLFVTVHCCDAQIDPGFSGKLTFEIVNFGPMRINLRENQDVAQIFIAKTTTKEVAPYQGRYQGATGPTHFRKALRE